MRHLARTIGMLAALIAVLAVMTWTVVMRPTWFLGAVITFIIVILFMICWDVTDVES